jgi:two-component system response regulator AtoC
MTLATSDTLAAHHRCTSIPPPSIIFGRSSVMSRLRDVVDPIALVPIPVFIHGATGTGKEVLANYIHQRSPMRDGPFVKVSCAAIPGSLLEAELFGFEIAHSGTLLLDDISELDITLQAKLLQFLQDGTFTRIGAQAERRISTRIICIANRSLQSDLEQGTFREDLFHRISGAIAPLPPLRERLEDLPGIMEYLLLQFAESFHVRPLPLSPAIIRRLRHYRWPGNIRELENVLRRYSLLGTPEALLEGLKLRSEALPVIEFPLHPNSPLKVRTQQLVRQAEAEAILHVLQEHDWNRTKSAQSLNISLRALLYKMRSAGISAYAPYKGDNKVTPLEALSPPD